MVKSLIRFLPCAALAGVLTGMLAACDTQSADPAQPQEEAAGDAGHAQLTGTLDRSFAGEPIPAVTVSDPAGITLDLAASGSQGDGKPILLNLWATWCAPCVVEMPLLDGLAKDLGENVRVVTVSEDMQGAEVVEPFFEENDFANLPRWMDPENELAFAYGGGAALPLTVLYDAEGREVWRVVGGYDWSSEEARALVTEAVAGYGEG